MRCAGGEYTKSLTRFETVRVYATLFCCSNWRLTRDPVRDPVRGLVFSCLYCLYPQKKTRTWKLLRHGGAGKVPNSATTVQGGGSRPMNGLGGFLALLEANAALVQV